MTSRNYCFTAWKEPCYNADTMRYIVWGEEICPNTSKVHYQGYVEFKVPVRISGAKKYLHDNSVHLEKRKGTRDQAICYCKKDGKVKEFGLVSGRKEVTPDSITETQKVSDNLGVICDGPCIWSDDEDKQANYIECCVHAKYRIDWNFPRMKRLLFRAYLLYKLR